MARPLRDRVIFELRQIRDELIEAVNPIPDHELDYAPAPGMKSYRGLLVEIGAMEAETAAFLATRRVPQWTDCEARVQGATTQQLLESLKDIRSDLFETICEMGFFDLSFDTPPDWVSFFGTERLEPEELVRWVARHEYYHLGQIISHRWIQGHNPYKR